MSNNNTISEEHGAEMCEIAYRIGRNNIIFDTDLFEIEISDLIFFYQTLYSEIIPHGSFFDDLDSIIENGAIHTHFKNWVEGYQEFK